MSKIQFASIGCDRIDAIIEEYLTLLETNDQQDPRRPTKVKEKIASFQQRMKRRWKTLMLHGPIRFLRPILTAA